MCLLLKAYLHVGVEDADDCWFLPCVVVLALHVAGVRVELLLFQLRPFYADVWAHVPDSAQPLVRHIHTVTHLDLIAVAGWEPYHTTHVCVGACRNRDQIH